MDNTEQLIEAAKTRNKRALSKLISAVEQGGADAAEVEGALRGNTGRARVIGITGPPGSGKSTLISSMIGLLRQRGRTVGVIAVDPTSPFTGGAILGDRVRMTTGADEGVFIRSMGSRGALGGLSRATRSAINVMDACGFDDIIVETMGVGQSEIEIVNNSDLILLLAVPGMGDDIQTIKAGLMEIGDVFVVNKSDLPGADSVAADIRGFLELSPEESGRRTPVVMVSAQTGEGMTELMDVIDSCFTVLEETGESAMRRVMRADGVKRSGLIAAEGATGMKCTNIDHIGVAVRSLEQSAEFYEQILGIRRTGVEEVEEQQVRVMFFPCGDCEVELLESTAEGSAVDRFIIKNGEGVQHIAIRVEDIDEAIEEMKRKGVRMIDEKPRYGAGGARIAFVHPKATNGVLLELCERR